MSNVGYDLDTSGGLMPLIRALIKPPDEDLNTSKPKKPQHPYYKRPGKGHNHDSCDACGEGGDLICCDRCPASFHLGCYDPPLDENDIPAGLWLCRECRASDEKPASTRSSRAQSPADNKSDTEKKTRSLRNSRANSLAKKKGKDDGKDKEEAELKKEMEPEREMTPMEILVKAAKVMNPKQFELPREMRIPCIFPGTEKADGGKNGSGLVTVDSWGCVPLPAKTCFVCQATCKMAPLLQCDYCPLLFHQDCLDPPLTALPTGRWMCPNHVEQFIDWKLVKSVSATERVALWERFSGPIDQHALKVDFIRRARNPRPSFRVKVPVGLRGRVAVPRMVRHHYRRPPPLLPSRREHVRCAGVIKNLRAGGVYSSDSSDTEEKHKICLNTSCGSYGGGSCPLQPRPKSLRSATSQDTCDSLEPAEEHQPDSDSSDFSDSDFEHLTTTVKKRKVSQTEEKAPGKRSSKPERLELCADEGVEELLATMEKQLNKLDERLIKLLAWQRLQQVAAGEAAAGRWKRSSLGEWGPRAAAALKGASRAKLAKLGVRRGPLPSELLVRADRERIAALVWGAAPPPPPLPPPPEVDLADTLVKAALCEVKQPVNGGEASLGAAVAMRLSALSIGSDSGCELVLSARCRQVSPRHAVIFCDEVTRHFELINYSEWGTRVNGVLYACDLARDDSQDDAQADTEARAEALRHIVRNRSRKPPKLNGSLTHPINKELECKCPTTPPPASAAWEGSALVPHGALLQFGCHMYVFSVTDQEPEPEPAL